MSVSSPVKSENITHHSQNPYPNPTKRERGKSKPETQIDFGGSREVFLGSTRSGKFNKFWHFGLSMTIWSIWFWRTCWFHMILFLSFHSQVKLFYRLQKLQKRLLRVLGLMELLIFCSNFVLGPFVLLGFFSNLIWIRTTIFK